MYKNLEKLNWIIKILEIVCSIMDAETYYLLYYTSSLHRENNCRRHINWKRTAKILDVHKAILINKHFLIVYPSSIKILYICIQEVMFSKNHLELSVYEL